jgi:hypothetical protein
MQASRARVRLPPGEETGTEPGRIPAPRRCRGRRGRAVTRSGRACERRRMREGETLVERKKRGAEMRRRAYVLDGRCEGGCQ